MAAGGARPDGPRPEAGLRPDLHGRGGLRDAARGRARARHAERRATTAPGDVPRLRVAKGQSRL